MYVFFFFQILTDFCLILAAQTIKCETRLRDKCRGATCNRSVSLKPLFHLLISQISTQSTYYIFMPLQILLSCKLPEQEREGLGNSLLRCGECPTNIPGCGTIYTANAHFEKLIFLFFKQSSICRAAIHFGVLDNNGGLVDVTRTEKFPFFVRATKNGVESLR